MRQVDTRGGVERLVELAPLALLAVPVSDGLQIVRCVVLLLHANDLVFSVELGDRVEGLHHTVEFMPVLALDLQSFVPLKMF